MRPINHQPLLYHSIITITIATYLINMSFQPIEVLCLSVISGLALSSLSFYTEELWTITTTTVLVVCLISIATSSPVCASAFTYLMSTYTIEKQPFFIPVLIIAYNFRWAIAWLLGLLVKNYFSQLYVTQVVMLKNKISELQMENINKETKFAALIHDLRNPLTSIIGCIDLLDTLNLDKGRDLVMTSHDCCEIMLTLINNILDTAKIDSKRLELNPVPVNINSLMIKVLGLFYEKAVSKSIELKYQISVNIPNFVIMDDSRIIQVLINMIGNAVKFTNSGEVRIIVIWEKLNSQSTTVELVELDIKKQFEKDQTKLNTSFGTEDSIITPHTSIMHSTQLHYQLNEPTVSLMNIDDLMLQKSLMKLKSTKSSQSNDRFISPKDKNDHTTIETEIEGTLRLTIADTGIGIPLDAQKKLFKPYQQAGKHIYREFGGTGLGLWLSNELVKLMKGRITLKSSPGKGTVFLIEIPLKAKDYITTDSHLGQSLNCIPNLNQPILLIENDFNRGLQLTKIFSFLGCNVTALNHTQEETKMPTDLKYSCAYTELLSHSNNHIRFHCAKKIAGKMPLILCTDYSKEVLIEKGYDLSDTIIHYPYKMKALAELLISIKTNSSPPSKSKLLQADTSITSIEVPNENGAESPIPCITPFFGAALTSYVVIVDDSSSIRIVMRGYVNCIKKKSLQAIECQSGKEAIEIYKRLRERIVLIFMDINMPGISGLQATDEILKVESENGYPHVAIIGLSGDVLEKGDKFDLVVTKPLVLLKFQEIIHTYCNINSIE